MKKTGWYRGDQKPVRVGVYERIFPNKKVWFSFWNGKIWFFADRSASYARSTSLKSGNKKLPWRGVAK